MQFLLVSLLFALTATDAFASKLVQQGTYVPPHHILVGFRDVAGAWGGLHRCSEPSKEGSSACTLLHKCGSATVVFKNTEIYLVQNGFALDEQCTKPFFLVQTKALVRLLSRESAEVERITGELGMMGQAEREPTSNMEVARSSSISFNGGTGRIEFQAYDTGVQQFIFTWLSSVAPIAR